jgi:signal peptidase I
VSDGRRGVPARAGIAALNLLSPGLGLLRTGPLRPALLFLLLTPAALALLLVYFLLAPTLSFAGYFGAVLIASALALGLLIAAVALTWRLSRDRPSTPPLWSRWYSILAAALAAGLVSLGLSDAVRACYKSFYIPSEAMSPTLEVNDRFVAQMRNWGPLRRGDLILCAVRDSVYVKRVAALPGDTIALRGGTVILNGRAVPQRFLRAEPAPASLEPETARRLAERFPGEAAEHEIYDSGPFPMDEMAERRIPPGFVFVLGDHRDRSADSRIPRAEGGVDLLALTEVRGRPLFYYWPWRKAGLPLTAKTRD